MRIRLLVGLLAAASGCAALEGKLNECGSTGLAIMPAAGGRPVLEGALADRIYDQWATGHLPGDVAHRSWGIRGGYLMPMDEEREEWKDVFVYGAFVRLLPRGYEYEFGIDWSQAESESGEIDSMLVGLRLDGLFPGARSGLYLLGGGQILVEQAENHAAEMARTMWTVNLNVGAGARTLGKRLDVRGTYSLVLGSENVQGVVLGTLSFLF